MTDIITKGKIFKEDTAIFDGGSATTGTRKTSTGGTQTLNKFDWVGADVHAIYGGRTSAELASAVAVAGTTNKRQLFLSPGAWALEANLTIPSNIHLVMAEGAQIDGGFTLTIDGRFTGGDDPFGGAVTVAWGADAVGMYYSSGALVIVGGATFSGATLTSPVINTGVSGTAVLDEDNMASNSDTKIATQQSIKAYVDSGTITMTNKTLTAPALTSPVINTSVSGTAVLDEDNMASNSATKLATQQSIKAYVDTARILTNPRINENVALSSTSGKIDARCYAYPSEVSSKNAGAIPISHTGLASITTADVGTVAAGDRIFVQYSCSVGSITTGTQMRVIVEKSSGTATITTLHDLTAITDIRDVIDNDIVVGSGIIKVTGAGTLVLRLSAGYVTGSVPAGTGQLYTVFEKKQ
jgi:hypothetical protein